MNTPSGLKHSLIIVVLLFTCFSTIYAQEAAPRPTPAAITWQPFESNDGRFSIQFPAPPKLNKVPFAKGPVTFMRHTHEVAWGGHFLEVDYWDLTTVGEDPDLVVEGGIAGMIRALEPRGGRLLSKETISVGSCKGRQAVLTFPADDQKEGFAVGRVFASGERAYALVFVSSTDDQVSRSMSQTFLNSFAIKGGCPVSVKPVTTVAAVKSTVAGATDPSTGWRRIESTQHGFSVLMPGEAQLEVEPAQTKPFPLTHYTYAHSQGDSIYSFEILTEYPTNFHDGPASLKTLLDITVYSMRRNLEPAGFSVGQPREIRLGTSPGQELDLTLRTTGKGRAQVIVTPRRVYIAVCVLGNSAPVSHVDRFFKSIKIYP